jgi:transposase-like protein
MSREEVWQMRSMRLPVRRTQTGRNHEAAFKAKVALEAVRGEKTMAQLSSQYRVHPNQIRQWKKRLLEELPGVFSRKRERGEKDKEELVEDLYRQIGQLKVELDWLKKKSQTLG